MRRGCATTMEQYFLLSHASSRMNCGTCDQNPCVTNGKWKIDATHLSGFSRTGGTVQHDRCIRLYRIQNLLFVRQYREIAIVHGARIEIVASVNVILHFHAFCNVTTSRTKRLQPKSGEHFNWLQIEPESIRTWSICDRFSATCFCAYVVSLLSRDVNFFGVRVAATTRPATVPALISYLSNLLFEFRKSAMSPILDKTKQKNETTTNFMGEQHVCRACKLLELRNRGAHCTPTNNAFE